MPVLYEPFQSTFPDKEGKKLYYPRVRYAGGVSTEQLAQEISERCSLTPGDVMSTFNNLVKVMRLHLQSSQTVTIDGLGSFRITMRSGGRGVEDRSKVSSSRSTLAVRFLPAATQNPDGTLASRSLLTGAVCMRFKHKEDEEEDETGGTGTGTGGGSEIPEAPEPMV
jgi:predicted histone-like DNA-binding protein